MRCPAQQYRLVFQRLVRRFGHQPFTRRCWQTIVDGLSPGNKADARIPGYNKLQCLGYVFAEYELRCDTLPQAGSNQKLARRRSVRRCYRIRDREMMPSEIFDVRAAIAILQPRIA